MSKKLYWTEADVRCPFYVSHAHKERCISCEGFGAGINVTEVFKNTESMDHHMGVFCAGRYESCPMFRCTYDNKYADR